MLVCEQRIEIFTFFGFKEVLGFITCIWLGKIRFIFKSNFKKINKKYKC